MGSDAGGDSCEEQVSREKELDCEEGDWSRRLYGTNS